MVLELVRRDGDAQAAVDAALALVPLELETVHVGYSSRWRLAGLVEAVDLDPGAEAPYAPSPRSTRGATLA